MKTIPELLDSFGLSKTIAVTEGDRVLITTERELSQDEKDEVELSVAASGGPSEISFTVDEWPLDRHGDL